MLDIDARVMHLKLEIHPDAKPGQLKIRRMDLGKILKNMKK